MLWRQRQHPQAAAAGARAAGGVVASPGADHMQVDNDDYFLGAAKAAFDRLDKDKKGWLDTNKAERLVQELLTLKGRKPSMMGRDELSNWEQVSRRCVAGVLQVYGP